ncbi:uncharacterized protein LOC133871148 isoform X1 [Alnus glutinosa]|uniref:uncharacterized protein LOC133871148 isoform X1 n=1 Tax=Alnus glutinosa TaxID=3517 RepID=UPI002D792F22|nr:uncharacterized protein LOC133871148 isoform X1 [Alnus glutinosa]
MEEQDQTQSSVEVEAEAVEQEQEQQRKRLEEDNVVQFLDSLDGYVTLLDSLSSTIRQGWMELASARHSMGASRINGAFLDMKFHSAATTVQVTEHDEQPHFALCKWASSKNGKCCSGEEEFGEDKLQMISDGPQLRHRSQFSDNQKMSFVLLSYFCHDNSELSVCCFNFWLFYMCKGTLGKTPAKNGTPLIVDDQVQKERSKSLSMFGTLVSPKLRAAQLSFETALETLVEIANMRSTMLSTYDQVRKDLEGTKG